MLKIRNRRQFHRRRGFDSSGCPVIICAQARYLAGGEEGDVEPPIEEARPLPSARAAVTCARHLDENRRSQTSPCKQLVSFSLGAALKEAGTGGDPDPK